VSNLQARRQLFRWLAWFAMANAVVLGLIGLRYLDGGLSSGLTGLSLLYLITIYVSHYSWLALLPLLVILSPLIIIRPSLEAVKALAVLLMAVIIAIIMLDSLLWSQSRFHINLLTVKILGYQSWIFIVVMFVIAVLFESLLAGRVWNWVKARPEHGGKRLGWTLFLCFAIAQVIHAWADASYYVPVTSIAQQLPVQRGFTAKKMLVRSGLVDISQSRERQLANRMARGLEQASDSGLAYPVEPLDCSATASDGTSPHNLLIILVDALRGGMLNTGLTPALDQFAETRASRFSNHYSGGNSSRVGVFSLFYGLPPGFFNTFEGLQKPPVLIEQLAERDYQLGVFTSANLYRPVALDRTVFSRVPNLRVQTEPVDASAWERDQIITAEWMQWLDQRRTDRPFFGFLFYDAVNDKAYPADFNGRVSTDPGHPMPQEFADYQTAIMFVDELIGQVLDDLERRGLADNTVVIITADHGEEFNENGDGVKGHSSGYSRYQLGVPMLLSWPGMPAQKISRRTSHYDIAPTLLNRLLGCSNEVGDYAIGNDLYGGSQWDWLITGSYYTYAVIEPDQITIVFPNGAFEVRDNNYRLLEQPEFNGDVLEAVMKANTRFYSQ